MNKTQKTILLIIIITIMTIAIFYIINSSKSRTPTGESIIEEEIPPKKIAPIIIEDPFAPEETSPEPIELIESSLITLGDFQAHNSEEDCWILYENKIYDYADAPGHPNMKKVFYKHCGTTTFEAAAKAKHSGSSENRVDNYGEYIGNLTT